MTRGGEKSTPQVFGTRLARVTYNPSFLLPWWPSHRELIYTGSVWHFVRRRLYCVACNVDLGLGAMVDKTAPANYTVNLVSNWFYPCHRICSARSFLHSVCSGSPVPLLRPIASQDISSRSLALPGGRCVWRSRRLASKSVALARSGFRFGNICVLDYGSIGRV